MDDSLDPSARAALEASLKEKVKKLLSEQAFLADQRAALLAEQRRNDRDLSDCRSTARLFRIDVDIPLPERELQSAREREIEMHNRSRMDAMERQRRDAEMRLAQAARNAAAHQRPQEQARLLPPRLVEPSPAPATATAALPISPAAASPQAKRPSLKDFLLQRLAEGGAEGAKAAPLREMFERTYGETIHEKTVGMTLYRMSKDNLVTREGHTWFIAPAPQGPETVNPGADTPGSDNRLL